MRFDFYAEEVLRTIKDAGFEAYFVGGCVRDALLGRQAHDCDIAAKASAEEIKKCFDGEKILPIGEKHGTVGILTEGGVVEVTSFRREGKYSDCRRPDFVSPAETVEEDLLRRDFTMNAVAWDGKFVDPFDGRGDIERKVIRCCGNPDRRFEEDALRILRALRFSAQLGFEIEEETKKSIRRNRELIKKISSERIFSEFKKLIVGEGAEKVLLEFGDVIEVFIPEIKESIGFAQKSRYHIYDVYTHSVKAMSACAADCTVRLAAFFHDVGKPFCFTEDEKGGHFYNHPAIGAEMTKNALTRLKADRKTVETVTELVKIHDREILPTKKSVRRVLAKYSPEFFDMLIEIKKGDAAAHAPWASDAGYAERLREIKDEILSDDECLSLKSLAINGRDMLALGLTGRAVGEALAALLEKVINEEVQNEHDALMKTAEEIIRR